MDFVSLLKTQKTFFEKNKEEKASLLYDILGQKYPSQFVDYIINTSEEAFISDIKKTVLFLKEKGSVQNDFLNAVAEFVAEKVSFVFDLIDSEFFFMDLDKRKNILSEFLDQKTFLGRNLIEFIAFSTYSEINEKAFEALKTLKDSKFIFVQSPVNIENEDKSKIRKFFLEKYPFSFVEFKVGKDLIGGMRVFFDGQLSDFSWSSKIENLKFKI